MPYEAQVNYSASYEEGIAYWQNLDKNHTSLKLISFGETDIGKPLHLAILSKSFDFTIDKLTDSEKPLLFINNAIHAGEPCGVDATMLFYRDILQSDSLKQLLKQVNVVAIPYYNVGGALNRNSHSRTNQNGPSEYGFRGNAKNLDLNRDFIKADSKNAKSFNELFSTLRPELFVDNHTSNGADYRHTITLINTVTEKLPPSLRKVMNDDLLPFLYSDMKTRTHHMVPYVFSMGPTPNDGIMQFNDSPRYSSGYAALHNSLSFTSETHMLKTYEERVESNRALMHSMFAWMAENDELVVAAQREADTEVVNAKEYTLGWQLDTTKTVQLPFLSYKAKYKESLVTGQDRLYYDHNEPEDIVVDYYPSFAPTNTVTKPRAYIIPQAYTGVIERLKWNNVSYSILDKDSIFSVEQYRIDSLKTRSQAYEGHFLHRDIHASTIMRDALFRAGDVIVSTGQLQDRYIMETLEPSGPDSFLAWNFFDGILQRKEYYSSYVFEDRVAELLEENPDWMAEMDSIKLIDELN